MVASIHAFNCTEGRSVKLSACETGSNIGYMACGNASRKTAAAGTTGRVHIVLEVGVQWLEDDLLAITVSHDMNMDSLRMYDLSEVKARADLLVPSALLDISATYHVFETCKFVQHGCKLTHSYLQSCPMSIPTPNLQFDCWLRPTLEHRGFVPRLLKLCALYL